jgi:hypothetical protein
MAQRISDGRAIFRDQRSNSLVNGRIERAKIAQPVHARR